MQEYRKFRPLNYMQIGRRIAEEREKLSYKIEDAQISIVPEGKKLSQEKLLQFMDQQQLPHFGRNTLSKLEQGYPEAFAAVTLSQWEALCSVFSCSVGYLFGEYDCRSFDREFIQAETGLSEAAIDKLIRIHSENKKSAHSDLISLLIESHNCEYFLALIGQSISYRLDIPHTPSKMISLDMDGSEMIVIKEGLIDSVLQTHIIEYLPGLAQDYAQNYEKTPAQREKEYRDHMKPLQEKLWTEEISSQEYLRAEEDWMNE